MSFPESGENLFPSAVRLRPRASPHVAAAWGAGRQVGPAVRALAFCEAAFGKAGFFGSCGNSLLLAENYN